MANYIVRKNKVISMIRGDTFSNNFLLNKTEGIADLELYDLTDGSIVYFALMYPNSSIENAILIKEYTVNDVNSDGTITVVLTPDDTELLPPGTYYYTLKLENRNSVGDNVYTIIPNTKFFILD